MRENKPHPPSSSSARNPSKEKEASPGTLSFEKDSSPRPGVSKDTRVVRLKDIVDPGTFLEPPSAPPSASFFAPPLSHPTQEDLPSAASRREEDDPSEATMAEHFPPTSPSLLGPLPSAPTSASSSGPTLLPSSASSSGATSSSGLFPNPIRTGTFPVATFRGPSSPRLSAAATSSALPQGLPISSTGMFSISAVHEAAARLQPWMLPPDEALAKASRQASAPPPPSEEAERSEPLAHAQLPLHPQLAKVSLPRLTILPFLRLQQNQPWVTQKVRERYEILTQMSETPLATYEIARDHDLQRLVILKRLKKSALSFHSIFRFLDEIECLTGLEHPGILPLYDVGLDPEGCYYSVMKYAEGESLRNVLRRLQEGDADSLQKFPLHRRLRMALELLRLVDFVHSRGILHRNLQPSNVMIAVRGEILLTGWEYAKKISEPHITPNPIGAEVLDALIDAIPSLRSQTPYAYRSRDGQILSQSLYQAPEIVAGILNPDIRSDIYSLCAILYEWLSLRPYSPAKSYDELRRLPLPRPLPLAPPELHPHIHSILLSGLSSNPEQRPSSSSEVFLSLDLPLSEPLPGLARFVSSAPWLSLAILLLLSALAAFGGMQILRLLFSSP